MMWFSSPGSAGKEEAAPNNARSSCFEYHLWVSLFKRRHHPLAEALTIFRTDFTYACHRHHPRARPARPLSKDSRAFRPNWTLLEKLSRWSCSTPREGFNSLQAGTRSNNNNNNIENIIIIIITMCTCIILVTRCITTVKWDWVDFDERPAANNVRIVFRHFSRPEKRLSFYGTSTDTSLNDDTLLALFLHVYIQL